MQTNALFSNYSSDFFQKKIWMLFSIMNWKLIRDSTLRSGRQVSILTLIWCPNSNYTKLPCSLVVVSRNQYIKVEYCASL